MTTLRMYLGAHLCALCMVLSSAVRFVHSHWHSACAMLASCLPLPPVPASAAVEVVLKTVCTEMFFL